ncbi:MAG: TonB-dependent receptor, partial [Bacteroidales bacterium]
LFCLNIAGANAQVKVSGTVTDKNKDPLIGVNIIVKGSQTGTISDVNGNYSIQAPNNKSVISFSYIGYRSVEKTAASTTINISLQEETHQMDEMVVIGYGSQKKSHLTGAVSSLKNEKLDEIPVSSVAQALQGKLAGVQIQNIDPEAGEAPVIRVRGMGSISAAVSPLVVVDGFPIPDGLASVSMGDVESIEVLKDAASAAMYGSRAAGGVILVTTKSGTTAKPKFNFKMYSGIRNILKVPEVLNTTQYTKRLYDDAALRMQDPAVTGLTGSSSNPVTDMGFNLITTAEKTQYLLETQYLDKPTDWLAEGLRDHGQSQSYQLSASGGTKDIKYFLSGNYKSEAGVMRYSNFDNYSLRAKVDINLSPTVTVGVNITPSYSRKQSPAVDLTDYIRYPSWLPVRHNAATAALTGKIAGDYAQAADFTGVILSGTGYNNEVWDMTTAKLSGSAVQTPVSVNERTSIFTDDYRVQSNAYITINILPGLQFKTANGAYTTYKEYNKKQKTNAQSASSFNTLQRQTTLHTELLSENTLNYTKKIGNHDIGLLAGYTIQKTGNKYNQIVAQNFLDDDMLSFNYASTLIMDDPYAANPVSGITSKYYTEAMQSFIGRVTYSYKGKYLFSGSLRSDGSSKFAEGHKWGTFPAGSVGWRVSEERFLKQFDWLSNLKFRASLGLTGNNNIPQYSYANKINLNSYSLGAGNGALTTGMSSNDNFLGNPDITWEQTQEANYGIDLGLFNSRLNISLEYYNSNTIQLLLQQPAMYITGHQTSWQNIGKVNNKGLELELSTSNINTRNFTWKTTGNISANRNTLINYGDNSYIDNFGEKSEVYRAIVGQPSIQYYGFKSDGVYTTFKEVTDALAKTDANGVAFNYGYFVPKIGALKVVNLNGDNKIDSDDRMVLGKPFPDFTWGITNTFTYKDFDMSFMIQGVQGVKIVDGNMKYDENLRNNVAYMNNRFVSPMFPGDGKTVYAANTSGGYLMLTDYAIEDGSYASLRDFTLGYKVPLRKVKAIGLNQLRVYFSGENLLYLMAPGFKGVNPEARRNSGPYSSAFPLVDGYQRGVFPLNQTYTLGVDINF